MQSSQIKDLASCDKKTINKIAFSKVDLIWKTAEISHKHLQHLCKKTLKLCNYTYTMH